MSVCISVWFTQMIKTTLKTPMLLWPLVWTLFALLMNVVIGKGIIDSCLFILQMKHQHPTHPVHTELKALSWFKHHLLLAGFLEIRISVWSTEFYWCDFCVVVQWAYKYWLSCTLHMWCGCLHLHLSVCCYNWA